MSETGSGEFVLQSLTRSSEYVLADRPFCQRLLLDTVPSVWVGYERRVYLDLNEILVFFPRVRAEVVIFTLRTISRSQLSKSVDRLKDSWWCLTMSRVLCHQRRDRTLRGWEGCSLSHLYRVCRVEVTEGSPVASRFSEWTVLSSGGATVWRGRAPPDMKIFLPDRKLLEPDQKYSKSFFYWTCIDGWSRSLYRAILKRIFDIPHWCALRIRINERNRNLCSYICSLGSEWN